MVKKELVYVFSGNCSKLNGQDQSGSFYLQSETYVKIRERCTV